MAQPVGREVVIVNTEEVMKPWSLLLKGFVQSAEGVNLIPTIFEDASPAAQHIEQQRSRIAGVISTLDVCGRYAKAQFTVPGLVRNLLEQADLPVGIVSIANDMRLEAIKLQHPTIAYTASTGNFNTTLFRSWVSSLG